MDSDTRHTGNFSYGGPARMDRLEQIVIPQHSTLAQPRMHSVGGEGANPLDLTSAIAHELQRSNNQLGWHSWNAQLGGGQPSSHEQAIGLELPGYGSYLLPQNAGGPSRLLPQNIPHFDDPLAPSMPQMPPRLDYSTQSESLASAPQGFYSRSANGLPLHLGHQQVLDHSARLDSSMRSACSPWIERMMQADVTPTPAPSLGISTSLSLAQRGVGDVSCVASQTVDFQSCHSSDLQQRSEKSMRSAFTCDPQRESTVEISADLCTDDEDQDNRPVDEKRKKRMLSNRASAQRSRQRRQERLDQLEVLTAQLRVENSTLQKKLSAALQVAKKFEDQNKNLQKKVEKLTTELESDKPKKPIASFDECANSQQTTCASSCEMVGGRTSADPNLMRDGNINDGASTPSMSAGSPGWPSGSCPTENGRELDVISNGNKAEVSPVRRSFLECRVGKKRSFSESEEASAGPSLGGSHSTSIGNHMGAGHVASQPSRPRPTGGEASSLLEPRAFGNSFGYDPALKDDSTMDCYEADRWLEFAECFK
ncbi:hypothetical protein KC19_6G120800 [Ceratodon purpureus]|uniref:BZIP domain-containing protein n=1 Tax=Ceratodon purpureus TaxID=3225 RepID=A0A8T0HHH4_CERPU|nr:hypothetical protein KC19_6G120800 [Ceratodon purpureus]